MPPRRADTADTPYGAMRAAIDPPRHYFSAIYDTIREDIHIIRGLLLLLPPPLFTLRAMAAAAMPLTRYYYIRYYYYLLRHATPARLYSAITLLLLCATIHIATCRRYFRHTPRYFERYA